MTLFGIFGRETDRRVYERCAMSSIKPGSGGCMMSRYCGEYQFQATIGPPNMTENGQ
jgi:hypothetical protein